MKGLLLTCLCWLLTSMTHSASLPSFPEVQQNWQSSYARLLDRHGQLLTRQRIIYKASAP